MDSYYLHVCKILYLLLTFLLRNVLYCTRCFGLVCGFVRIIYERCEITVEVTKVGAPHTLFSQSTTQPCSNATVSNSTGSCVHAPRKNIKTRTPTQIASSTHSMKWVLATNVAVANHGTWMNSWIRMWYAGCIHIEICWLNPHRNQPLIYFFQLK